MKLVIAVVYAVSLGFGWGWVFNHSPEIGPMPATCFVSGQYTKTQNPIRVCAPEMEQSY